MRKENISRIIQSTLLSAAMLFGMCGMSAVSAETNAKASFEGNTGSSSTGKWQVSKSKTAAPTELNNDNNTTDVTLSLPSAEEELTSDIVFVMDGSSCEEDTAIAVGTMLTDLYNSYSQSTAKMNVGIIGFRGNASTAYPLTEYKGDTEAIKKAILDYKNLKHGDPDSLHGTNIPAGLQAAKAMLDGSSTPNTRKHMILVSDGATYLYTHGNPSECYSRTTGILTEDGSLYEWVPKYGMDGDKFNFPSTFANGGDANDWSSYMTSIAAVRANFTTYDQVYTRSDNHPKANLTVPNPAITDASSFETNVEESLWQSYDAFAGMTAEGYSCYAVNPSTNSNLALFTSFMSYLGSSVGKGSGTDFSDVEKTIQYLLNSGKVTDVIDDHFDLVNDGTNCPFTLTKSGTKLDAVSTNANEWSFGSADASGTYPYVVAYASDTNSFVWTINVPVENANPLQLKYTLKVKSTVTESGTFDTNASATLDYTDSNGNSSSEEFEKPSVVYTYVPEPTATPATQQWCVTFLDCKGNTVSVQWVKNGENATAPTGFGTYSGYTNITGHRDLKPTSCGTNTGWVVPNTADRS